MLSLGTGARGSREGMSMEMNKAQALPLMSLQSRRDRQMNKSLQYSVSREERIINSPGGDSQARLPTAFKKFLLLDWLF